MDPAHRPYGRTPGADPDGPPGKAPGRTPHRKGTGSPPPHHRDRPAPSPHRDRPRPPRDPEPGGDAGTGADADSPAPTGREDAAATAAPGPEAGRTPRSGSARRRRTANVAIGTVSALALCAGVWLLQSASAADAPPQPTAAEAGDHTRDALPSAPALPAAAPSGIRIPRIKVDAPLMDLSLTPDGSLDVPPADRSNLAGWYAAGTTPGERGTAIVAGHVDNARGPAVFYALGALRKDDRVEVPRADGRTALFTVDAVEVYDTRDFPDEKVYGAASRPELRIITCGGSYSKKTGYQGNVVVFAHLTGSDGG